MSLIEMRKENHLRSGLIELANDVKSALGDNLNIIEIETYAGESSHIFTKNDSTIKFVER